MPTGALRKNIFREIRSTLNRFLAIFAITALGAGFFAGLRATGPSMVETADVYFADTHLLDIRLLSTMGFTDEDVAAIASREDVAEVMPTWGLDLLVQTGEAQDAVRLHALPQDRDAAAPAYLNQVALTEGRLPTAPGEAAADSESHYRVGDVITLAPENDADSLELMAATEFTVVGIVTSPYYISFSRGNTNIGDGSLSTFLYLDASAFDSEYYTEIYLTLNGAAGLGSQSEGYLALAQAAEKSFEEFGELRAEIRYNDIVDEAETQLADARQELADGRAEADTELADAWAEIEDGRRQLTDGRREIAENRQTLADAEQEIADGERQLASGRTRLEDGRRQYEAGVAEYREQEAVFNAGVAEYEENLALFEATAAQHGQLAAAAGELTAGVDAMGAMLPGIGLPEVEQQFALAAGQTIGGLRGAAAALAAAGVPATATDGMLAAATGAETALAYGLYGDAHAALAQGVNILNTVVEGMGAEIAEGRAALDAAATELAAGGALLAEGWQTLEDARAELESGEAELAGAENTLNAARAEVADGWRQLREGEAELADAERELADGIAKYEDGKAEADAEIADGEREIADAEAELADLAPPDWYVFTRDGNPGYQSFGSNAERISAIASILPYFFFLVAALVCLTTMTRMVEEQRTGIGTLKALGFGRGAIAFKFLLYAGLASLLGSAVGVVVCYPLFPSVIWNAYRMMYVMPSITYHIDIWLILQSVLSMTVVTVAATLASCLGILRSVPADLMRPKPPASGTRIILERIPALWSRMKFSWKVTARNLLRYKKRFFMTVVGVAGCTALLLTGFGLYDSISGIVEKQYSNVSHYDMIVQLADPSTAGADSDLNRLLAELGAGAYVVETAVDAEGPAGTNGDVTTYMSVMEDPAGFAAFVTLQNRQTGAVVDIAVGDGVVITEKLAGRLGVSAGDRVRFGRSGEDLVEATVLGVAENYVYNYIYVPPATYEALFGTAPEYNRVYLNLAQEVEDQRSLLARVVETEGVSGAVGIEELRGEIDDMMQSLNSVIWVILLCAGLLAFVVLYNLTNINITERQREIATLKVLGFYEGEVSSYVYRENVLLTVIGTLLGLGLGIFLHRYVILTAEIDEVMFGRAIGPLSYVLAVAFTLACGAIVNLVMLKKLRKIDMVESLKSAE